MSVGRAVRYLSLAFALVGVSGMANAQAAKTAEVHPKAKVCTQCMRATVEFLASDAMKGRGSATEYELIAAEYAASELRKAGIAPAWPDGSYFQKVPLTFMNFTAPPTLTIAGTAVNWTAGKQFIVRRMPQPEVSGKLQRATAQPNTADEKQAGRILLVQGLKGSASEMQKAVAPYLESGAAAVMVEVSGPVLDIWEKMAERLTDLPVQVGDEKETQRRARAFPILVRPEAAKELANVADGAEVRLAGQVSKTTKTTWNVTGVLKPPSGGSKADAIMFSAHMDHVGVRVQADGSDSIFNGADDDATGVSAVLELARILGSEAQRPKRPVFFTLFGSEELGLLGSRYMAEHPPVPLAQIAAVVQFEQLGHPEPKTKPDELWMTGWERSDLGPRLAKQGATLVADPYPDQNFFRGSDNYSFAERGVAAHTISASGHFPQYHTPEDEVRNLDWERMRLGFGGVLDSLLWLANSDFRPTFKPEAASK